MATNYEVTLKADKIKGEKRGPDRIVVTSETELETLVRDQFIAELDADSVALGLTKGGKPKRKVNHRKEQAKRAKLYAMQNTHLDSSQMLDSSELSYEKMVNRPLKKALGKTATAVAIGTL